MTQQGFKGREQCLLRQHIQRENLVQFLAIRRGERGQAAQCCSIEHQNVEPLPALRHRARQPRNRCAIGQIKRRDGRGATCGVDRIFDRFERLCIARALALEPEVILMDEPCSALDPISTGKIEELIHELKNDYTVLIVTHNMQQAARCSDFTAYMYLGELIEFGATTDIFMKPKRTETEDYITGRFG
mgnify:CR=1 FL=1